MNRIKIFFGWIGLLVGIILISALVLTAAQAQTSTFTNPLNTSRGADPWMTYYNGEYYLTATTWSSDPNVGITMKHAPTIAGLKAATPQRIFFDTTSNRCCNIWAPEFHLMNGPNGQRWYLYYVAGVAANTDSQRIHVAESAGLDPMGPYTYKGTFAAGGPTDAWAVDPTIMTINGQYYLFYSAYEGAHYSTSQNIYGVALSNPWTQSGSRALIARPTFTWETGTAAVNEAPVQLTAPNGQVYLVFSATWCGNPNYQLGRAAYNGGPVLAQSSWNKFNGVIFTHGNGQSSTAHNGFFMSPDGTEYWMVYHGVDNLNGDCGATLRTTRIQKFTWNADNTPNMGVSVALTTSLNVPSGEGGVGPTPTRTNTPTVGPSPTPTNTPPPGTGPIHWYKFDGNTTDSGSSPQNATLVNGPTYVTGKNAQAVDINGGTQYATLPAGIVSGLTNFTIATWVKIDTTAAWRRIFDFGNNTTVNMFLVPTNGSTIRFAITTGGNGAEQQINGTSALPTGVWKHVAVTHNGNIGTLYVDGVQVGQNTNMTLSPSSLGNTTLNYIGKSQYPDPNLDGQIDQFRIYNRALSAAEVLALFQTP
jgi:GH43 family beta-xylosidase